MRVSPVVLSLIVAAPAAAQLRIAAWNISAYDGTDRAADIQRAVYGTFQGRRMAPDVLCVQEVESAAALVALRNALNTAPGYPNPPSDLGSPGDWAFATFEDGPDSEAVLLYRTSKVVLVRDTVTVAVGAASPEQPRNTYRWDIRPFGYSSIPANCIGVYGVHLKAGSTSGDNARRLIETQRIRDNAEGVNTNGSGTGLPAGYQFLVLGDFNMQSSSQSSYAELVGSQANNSGRFFDPINAPGSWNNNGAFSMVHTQDPVGAGGMDDRHDQILLSGGLLDSAGMDYIGVLSGPQNPVAWNLSRFDDPNHSYRCYGNDGTSFNAALNTTSNLMVGNAIAQAIANCAFSDLGAGGHMPVFLDLRVPPRASNTASLDFGTVVQGAPSPQRTLVVQNAGDTALWTVNGIANLAYSMSASAGFSAPGGNFTEAPGGGSNTHTITMSTATLGPRNGTLTLSTSDPERPSIQVTLTGTVVPPNQPPVADAGPDQTLEDADGSGDEPVTLDGSASTDPDGTISNYRWAEGPTVLSDGPSPTAAVSLSVGSHTINLTVTDNGGLTADDVMVVEVVLAPPTCDPDVNCDGSVNGFDIEAMEQAVNGDFSNFCQPDSDYNQDGSVNGFDVEAVEQGVNGGPCP
ncbi:hypothetical protein PHYC_03391 [Phycisphaerales bacterium]|nr:hypothetical protein PHYC_03391 [Phycisphaerales bacterium]